MKLINIDDNNHSESNEPKIAIGIDLGTTNSLVAFSNNQTPKILHQKNESQAIKSILSINDKGNIIVGSAQENSKTLKSVKRLMGKSAEDLDPKLKTYNYDLATSQQDKIIKLNFQGEITPIEASAEILKTLKIRADKLLKSDINDAVITVPAYFDDAARNATLAAAKLADLNILRLINEPTAAALAYGFDKELDGYFAIFDFGGGTFDVSILKMNKGIFQVIATKGDNFLGGDDLDIEIAKYFETEFKLSAETALEQANIAKEFLTSNKEYKNTKLNISLKKEKFEELIKPICLKTIDILTACLKDAKINTEQLKETILVGGSTKTPYLKKLLTNYLGKKPLDNINPDTVVALGAALQAEYLTKGTGNLLIDIIPLSLGLETMGGITEKIIPRNTPIPITHSQKFTTFKDNQTAMQIHIVQGERELSSENRSLAFFELKNIPAMPAGKAVINITFKIDMDGILTVSAEEETSQTKQEILVKPSYGLEPEQLRSMLEESMKNAKTDMINRIIAKNSIAIESFCDQIIKTINDPDYNFSNEHKKEAEEICKKSLASKEELQKSSNHLELDKLQKTLKNYLNDLCLEKINMITDSLQGKTIAEIDNLFKNSQPN